MNKMIFAPRPQAGPAPRQASRSGLQLQRIVFALALATFATPGIAHAEKDRVLYSFNAGLGPFDPSSGPIRSKSGELYFSAANYSNLSLYPGAVVEASLNDAGTKVTTVKTLHVFTGVSGEGAYPSALLLRNDALYGTTYQGGDLSCPLQPGCGTVFKLTYSTRCPPTDWCETVLYQFRGKRDGMEPSGSVIADKDGDLFGTTQAGGGTGCQDGCGTIFELKVTKPNSTRYTESILYSFPPRPGT